MPVCWGAQHLPQSIDFVLLDGAKGLYPDILSLLEERLRVGALIVADNANLRAPGDRDRPFRLIATSRYD